jgi:hypothetical protein
MTKVALSPRPPSSGRGKTTQLFATKVVALADPTEVAAELLSIGETVELLKQM